MQLDVDEFHVDRLILNAALTEKTVKLEIAVLAHNLTVELALLLTNAVGPMSFRNNSGFDLGLLVDEEANYDPRSFTKVAVNVALAGSGLWIGSVIESAHGHPSGHAALPTETQHRMILLGALARPGRGNWN